MNAKHSIKQCVLCDKVCASETDLVRHHNQCLQKGISTVACPKCTNTFTSLGLRRHKPQCMGREAQYECSDCDKVGKSKNEIRKHISEDHAEQRVRSREVCYHWRNGHCTRGESCHFSHVGHQNSQSTQKTPPNKSPVEMVKDVFGRKGDSVCSTTMELASRSLGKCKACKEDVNTKDRFREHSYIDHRVSNSVVIMKDVITSPLVISPTPQPRVFLNIQGNKSLK